MQAMVGQIDPTGNESPFPCITSCKFSSDLLSRRSGDSAHAALYLDIKKPLVVV